VTQPTLSITESNVLQALGQFLVAILPTGTAIVVGQDNRVPMPQAANYAVMTPITRTRLATNLTEYTDGFPSNPQIRQDTQATNIGVQVDTFGPLSGDHAQILATMFRSDWGVDQFGAMALGVTPLYTSEPRQMKFNDESHQVQQRWTTDVYAQIDPIVTVTQDFAAELVVGVIEVDAAFPPA
jgi:hypothetical protein